MIQKYQGGPQEGQDGTQHAQRQEGKRRGPACPLGIRVGDSDTAWYTQTPMSVYFTLCLHIVLFLNVDPSILINLWYNMYKRN